MIQSNLFSSYESAVLDDNLEHSGGLTVSWKAASGGALPVGTSIEYNDVKYSLLDQYIPERNDAVSWRYSPKFLHPVNRLDRVPFYIETEDENHEKYQMSTINFTGLASTIANKFAEHFAVYGATDSEFNEVFNKRGNRNVTWTAVIPSNANTIITVNFDGCSIKAAGSRIADALGCNVFYDWDSAVVRFIVGTTIEGASYNCFHVLGGTTNMAKKSISGIMVPVTQRLTLPSRYAGSIIDRSGGNIKLTTDIILDDIYPKMELKIASVRERRCYVTDEAGEKVKDANNQYKFYSKWYITLKYTDNTAFSMSDVVQIADKPLSILFQPDLTNIENSSKLAGHQFEIVYYGANVTEWGIDDVEPDTNKWIAAAGEFRIIFKAEGSTILPSTGTELLCPNVDDKVTLVNVSLSDHYKEIAQAKLEDAATEIADMMMADGASRRGTVLNGGGLTIGQGYTMEQFTGIITDINLNVDTGVAEVTVGTWKSRKTLSGSMVDKIDSINITTRNADQGATGMSKTQWDALSMASPKTVVSGMKERINLLGVDIEAIKNQEDQQFGIWFGSGAPTLNNYPASSWTTDAEKDLHVQDIYYDISRSPASTGGRSWRFLKDNGVYGWTEVTDLDTVAALEKIADVASDGVICAGAEKQRVYVDWHNAMKEYTEYTALTENYGIDSARTAYISAYQELWQLLNGGSAPDTSNNQSYTTPPAWIEGSALSEDTHLADDYSGTIPSGSTIEQVYRSKWDAYYEKLAKLLAASDARGKTLTQVAYDKAKSMMAGFVNFNLPTPPYKLGDLWWKLHSQTPNVNAGDLYICVVPKADGETAAMSDWMPANDYLSNSASLMTTLAEQLEANISSKYVNNNHSVVVSWGTEPQNPSNGDVWYDAANEVIKEYSGSAWSAVSQYEVDLVNTVATFKALMRIDQQQDRSVTFWQDPSFVSNAEKYDVCFKRSQYVDHLTGRTVDGELGIWLYGDNAWSHERDNVSGVMQNYGDQIIAAVFGDQVDPTDPSTAGLASYMAGFTTTKNFASMFAEKAVVDANGNSELKTKAGIAVHIETEYDPVQQKNVDKGYVDITGTFRSSDGEVVIDQYENPYHVAGDGSREVITCMEFDRVSVAGMSPNEVGAAAVTICTREREVNVYSSQYITSEPWISLKKFHHDGQGNATIDEETNIIGGEVYASNIVVAGNKFAVGNNNGVGTPTTPVTFTTADGKTVTVIGGIITDVS